MAGRRYALRQIDAIALMTCIGVSRAYVLGVNLTQLLTREDVFWDFAGKGKLGYDQIPGSFGVWPEQIADFLALAGDARW